MFSADRKPGQLRRVVIGIDSKGVSIIQSGSILDPQTAAPNGKGFSTISMTDTFWTPVLDTTNDVTRPIRGMAIRSSNGKCLPLTYGYNFLLLTIIIRGRFLNSPKRLPAPLLSISPKVWIIL